MAQGSAKVDTNDQASPATVEQLDTAAVDLLNHAMNDAIPAALDDVPPLSATASRAAAAVTVSLLRRSARHDVGELLVPRQSAGDAGFSTLGPYQIHRAAVIVSQALNRAADGETVHIIIYFFFKFIYLIRTRQHNKCCT